MVERPDLAQQFDQLLLAEPLDQFRGQRWRQTDLLCGPVRREAGDRVGQLEDQVLEDFGLDAGLGEVQRGLRGECAADVHQSRTRRNGLGDGRRVGDNFVADLQHRGFPKYRPNRGRGPPRSMVIARLLDECRRRKNGIAGDRLRGSGTTVGSTTTAGWTQTCLFLPVNWANTIRTGTNFTMVYCAFAPLPVTLV